MKHILLITATLLFIGCARPPLNVYSPAAVNTVIVKEDGDAGINVSYFSNGPKHLYEKDKASNGIALQARAVLYNKWFLESSFNFLKEATTGEYDFSGNTNKIFKSNVGYNNKEIGIGKLIDINKNGTSKILLSAGYGNTNYNNKYEITSNNKVDLADFNFTNNHIYVNAQFQFDFGILKYQVGLKNSFINFRNVATNNISYFGDEVNALSNGLQSFRSSTQLFNDFGVYPFKNNNWLSMHAGFSFSSRIILDERFKNRTVGGSFSIMANPSKFLKKKK
jgi:hypothetical protein